MILFRLRKKSHLGRFIDVVDAENVDPKIAVPAFVNVNDGTNEGLAYVGKNIFTVQFHPEACPGPQDSSYLFDRFIEMMEGAQ